MESDREFVGYRAAAAYLKMPESSLKANVVRQCGPSVSRREVDRHYVRPVFAAAELDRWFAERPGRGRRTDLG